jgi:hypothetical protein
VAIQHIEASLVDWRGLHEAIAVPLLPDIGRRALLRTALDDIH